MNNALLEIGTEHLPARFLRPTLAQMQQKAVTPELLATAINSGLSACLIVAALAVGLAVPGLVFYRQRPLI